MKIPCAYIGGLSIRYMCTWTLKDRNLACFPSPPEGDDVFSVRGSGLALGLELLSVNGRYLLRTACSITRAMPQTPRLLTELSGA